MSKNVSLVNVFQYYEELSHQDKAIKYIEDTLAASDKKQLLSEASDFVKTWRGASSGDETKFVSLVDVAKFYEELPHQKKALKDLQEKIEADFPTLFDETEDFVRIWRNQLLTPQPGRLITFDSIGQAKIGMTFGELKEELGSEADFQKKSPYMDGFDAIEVRLPGDNKPRYNIVYPSGSKLKNDDKITMLITENPKFRTAEGVGPGVLVSKAAEVYGTPTFAYSTEVESKEVLSFPKQDQDQKDAASRRQFRPKALCYDFAGIYLKSIGSLNQTNEFHDNACIWQVSLVQLESE